MMDKGVLTRRALVSALAALAAAPGIAAAAAPLSATRFREIQVDVAPLRANGSGDLVDWIAAELPALLAKAFAEHMAPGDRSAPILRARVDFVTLGPPGSFGGLPLVGDTTDYIEGAGVVVGAGGREIASYPLMASLHASSKVVTGMELRLRVSQLAQSFAYWLPRQMGL
jgi:hypothetical protein